jgi:hypothetical protein
MPKHMELVSISADDPNYRFCLDQVEWEDEENRTEYAFVWRGTRASSEGFVPKPAYFKGKLLGSLLKQAFIEGRLPDNEIGAFVRGLLGNR